ncbi:DUF1203 domain-containing protein [Mesorhizobium sp. M7A.F.Ca.CA.002.05.1.1]|uniref:DUF1203 domain-containing protein n=1 Tax=Mesorhizobium sp. M7A.F.Ca.CA.002.05.1.1 TaxID=2496704 RepID=UPI000FCBD630|nr:DUF1203 domain-containing protein [Mesorhizobium sp. M7A.F.Ca.CA.002.05.1.1]RVA00096.1 DUF1203 domain-containing protein [Mesorhizobium sp. M7A.F.Ca.CA.002.05.1.1]
MTIQFKALPTEGVRTLQRGGIDAYGQMPERKISDGDGMPCRHCLKNIAAGDAYLVLAYRPFPQLQPYAETGPIFLHGEECDRAAVDDAIIPTTAIAARAETLFERDEIAYVHVRSARNNCYQCRIERA